MICFVGLIIFAILGIFSATYREYTIDALNCMLDKATRTPCQSNFDEKYKSWVLDKTMNINLTLSKYVNRYFKHLNWVIFVLMLFLTFETIAGIYNLYMYGSCNPEFVGCGTETVYGWLQ